MEAALNIHEKIHTLFLVKLNPDSFRSVIEEAITTLALSLHFNLPAAKKKKLGQLGFAVGLSLVLEVQPPYARWRALLWLTVNLFSLGPR